MHNMHATGDQRAGETMLLSDFKSMACTGTSRGASLARSLRSRLRVVWTGGRNVQGSLCVINPERCLACSDLRPFLLSTGLSL